MTEGSNNFTIKDTEALRADVLHIREELRAGRMSNATARTMLYGAKVAIETVKLEMAAKQIGHYNKLPMAEEDRTVAKSH